MLLGQMQEAAKAYRLFLSETNPGGFELDPMVVAGKVSRYLEIGRLQGKHLGVSFPATTEAYLNSIMKNCQKKLKNVCIC